MEKPLILHFKEKKYLYLQTAIKPHLESVSIFLYEVIVHSTDHPLVIIQNLSLRRNTYCNVQNLHNIGKIISERPSSTAYWPSNCLTFILTGCMLISHPVFSPGSFIRSKPKRSSIPSVNWLRSSRLTADKADASSLKNQQHEIYCNKTCRQQHSTDILTTAKAVTARNERKIQWRDLFY